MVLQCSADDGYLSEGGASFYAKKIQSRIAFEKQKTVEEQNRNLEANKRPLPGKEIFWCMMKSYFEKINKNLMIFFSITRTIFETKYNYLFYFYLTYLDVQDAELVLARVPRVPGTRGFFRPYCLATLFKPGGKLCHPHYYLAPAATKS